MELRPVVIALSLYPLYFYFNRTIMELRLLTHFHTFHHLLQNFNRTIMELRLFVQFNDRYSIVVEFQSNHNGIETPIWHIVFRNFNIFQSNHNGIETELYIIIKFKLRYFNRTIMELRRFKFYVHNINNLKFQSNHNGIETSKFSGGISPMKTLISIEP